MNLLTRVIWVTVLSKCTFKSLKCVMCGSLSGHSRTHSYAASPSTCLTLSMPMSMSSAYLHTLDFVGDVHSPRFPRPPPYRTLQLFFDAFNWLTWQCHCHVCTGCNCDCPMNHLKHFSDPNVHFKSTVIQMTHMNKFNDPLCIFLFILLETKQYYISNSTTNRKGKLKI